MIPGTFIQEWFSIDVMTDTEATVFPRHPHTTYEGLVDELSSLLRSKEARPAMLTSHRLSLGRRGRPPKRVFERQETVEQTFFYLGNTAHCLGARLGTLVDKLSFSFPQGAALSRRSFALADGPVEPDYHLELVGPKGLSTFLYGDSRSYRHHGLFVNEHAHVVRLDLGEHLRTKFSEKYQDLAFISQAVPFDLDTYWHGFIPGTHHLSQPDQASPYENAKAKADAVAAVLSGVIERPGFLQALPLNDRTLSYPDVIDIMHLKSCGYADFVVMPDVRLQGHETVLDKGFAIVKTVGAPQNLVYVRVISRNLDPALLHDAATHVQDYLPNIE